jgi:hypothetical protein
MMQSSQLDIDFYIHRMHALAPVFRVDQQLDAGRRGTEVVVSKFLPLLSSVSRLLVTNLSVLSSSG